MPAQPLHLSQEPLPAVVNTFFCHSPVQHLYPSCLILTSTHCMTAYASLQKLESLPWYQAHTAAYLQLRSPPLLTLHPWPSFVTPSPCCKLSKAELNSVCAQYHLPKAWEVMSEILGKNKLASKIMSEQMNLALLVSSHICAYPKIW